jgi:hypothetical protein
MADCSYYAQECTSSHRQEEYVTKKKLGGQKRYWRHEISHGTLFLKTLNFIPKDDQCDQEMHLKGSRLSHG